MFEEEAEYSFGVKVLLALPIAILVAIFWLTLRELKREDFAVIFLILGLILTVYWLILPRRFRILDDSLEIVSGITYRIPFSEIREVKKGSGKELIFFRGFSLATSRNLIIVRRRRGFSLTISPRNADLFLEHLKSSLETFKRK